MQTLKLLILHLLHINSHKIGGSRTCLGSFTKTTVTVELRLFAAEQLASFTLFNPATDRKFSQKERYER